MTLIAAPETSVNYEETAELATQAFGGARIFSASSLRWFYERAFGHGACVVALRQDDRKIGQIVMVRQKIMVNGQDEQAAQLVDLFIAPHARGSAALRALYDEVEQQFLAENIRFAIGMPNAKAVGVNAHFFKLMPHLVLPIRVGISWSRRNQGNIDSFQFDPKNPARAKAIFSRFKLSSGNGVRWDSAALIDRLAAPNRIYGIHATDHMFLVSSPRKFRGIPYTLLCGFFVDSAKVPSRREVMRLVDAACVMWSHPLYVHIGLCHTIAALPGFALPHQLRPSPMLVQLRDFHSEKALMNFDHYQLLDFDFG